MVLKLSDLVMAFRCSVIPFETSKKSRLFDQKTRFSGESAQGWALKVDGGG